MVPISFVLYTRVRIVPEIEKHKNIKRVKDVYDQCLDSGINETVEWTEMPAIVRNNNLRFVDGEFYPAFESLYADGKESHHCTEDYVVWRRSSDFCSLQWPMIFKDPLNMNKSILPSFVNQGLYICEFRNINLNYNER